MFIRRVGLAFFLTALLGLPGCLPVVRTRGG